MEHQNLSSYAKTRPVLRICSKLEDKTGTMCTKTDHNSKDLMEAMGEKHMNWTLTLPNQQQDLDQDTNSTRRTLKLKYAKFMAWKVLGQEIKVWHRTMGRM